MLAIISAAMVHATELPAGSAPDALEFEHFPNRVHAFVWRNWPLVPVDRMAEVAGVTRDDLVAVGKAMGLPDPPVISDDQWRRSYITIIRRNWHLLPYDQLVALLGWTPEQLAYTLREDDFLFVKLGSLKPKCEPLTYIPPDENAKAREQQIAAWVSETFPDGLGVPEDPLFGFIADLSKPPPKQESLGESRFNPRFCSSYFTLYGDPLLETEADSYPPGYLERLAQSGANGVWLQAVLYKLAPYPWDESLSEHYEERLANLRELVARAKAHGIGIYLYLNEPRAMPLAFYDEHPDLKGVVEGDHAALCTSAPAVQDYLRDAIAGIVQAAPDLAGFFTISGSENLTNCWSHGRGATCPKCSKRAPEEVIAELHRCIHEGIQKGSGKTRLIAWDWGWNDAWVPGIVERLPEDVALQSVSEWSIPIKRGGVDTVVGEYSISTVGPGPRATRHWGIAQARGLQTLAKIQANNTWEISAVPYIPAIENVAQQAANLRKTKVDGLMLGWTLGGHPSPNLEVVAEIGRSDTITVDEALAVVAERRFGAELAPAMVDAWRGYSAAFREYPYHGGLVYRAPVQMGPANLLWAKPTGYAATMVGIPYDNLDGWRAVYPRDVFVGQFDKMADGFEEALGRLKEQTRDIDPGEAAAAFRLDLDVAEACAIHFRSVANQGKFVMARDALATATETEAAHKLMDKLAAVLESEIDLAKRLYAIQTRNSRIGFESSNHYFYIPIDLVEKAINCRYILDEWLPNQDRRYDP